MTVTPTPVDPDRAAEVRSLVDLMDGVLEKVVAAYDNAGVSLPGRRYWTLGEVVGDCEQVTVTFIQAHFGPPGDEAAAPQRCEGPRTATLQVTVMRCVPTAGPRGRPPGAADIQSGSEQLMIDSWLLLDIAGSLDQWDPVGPGMGVIATVDAGSPSGGLQAVTLQVSMAIP